MKKKLLFSILISGKALASDFSMVVAPPENYADYPPAQEWLKKQDLDYDFVLESLRNVKRDSSILAKISKPAEKTKPWYEYRKIFSDEESLKKGIQFFLDNETDLLAAEKKYGVDPYVITAIIGVETRYGKVTGKTHVLSALATLCFDYPPRAKFFCSELNHFYKLAQREEWNLENIKGSYAGAMGMAQFMPSSYFNDARDGNQDGKIDLWGSASDAIFSIANYLKNRDWKSGEINYATQLSDISNINGFGKSVKPHLNLKNLKDIKLQDEQNLSLFLENNHDKNFGSLVLEGKNGNEYWLTHHNFYVITRYNTSPMYAMAVANLANAIREEIIKR